MRFLIVRLLMNVPDPKNLSLAAEGVEEAAVEALNSMAEAIESLSPRALGP